MMVMPAVMVMVPAMMVVPHVMMVTMPAHMVVMMVMVPMPNLHDGFRRAHSVRQRRGCGGWAGEAEACQHGQGE